MSASKFRAEQPPDAPDLTDDLFTARAALRDYGKAADCDLDLGEAALLLAALARPGAAIAPYRRHLCKLVTDVADYLGGDDGTTGVELRHEALVQILVKRHGYLGATDCFNDTEAASLIGVIDRRSGLPVALGILFLHVAGRLGWSASGLDFPGRFLVRLDGAGGQRLIFDPFDAGRKLAAREMREILKALDGVAAELSPAHYRTMTAREVLLRLQGNVKKMQLDARRWNDAAEVLEATLLVAPSVPVLWYERGMLLAQMERHAEAIEALESYLSICGAEASSYQASLLLQRLKSELN